MEGIREATERLLDFALKQLSLNILRKQVQ